MLKSYLTIAFRNMMRHKTHSFINIFGLSVGVACCLLLMLFIQDEISYDQQHKQINSLYRIISHLNRDTSSEDVAACSPPLAMALKEEVPEIENALRLVSPPGVTQSLIRYDQKSFYETDGYLTDSTLFDLFSFDFKEGTPTKALVDPNSVVIAEAMAKKLFGDKPALNKVISIAQGITVEDYKITGVIRNIERSHIKANFFISMSSYGAWPDFVRQSNEWAGQNFVSSYVLLQEGSAIPAVEKKMNEVLMKHAGESMKAFGFHKTLSLEPVKDIYLRSAIGKSPRIIYIYVIGSIAVFILLIACINFINLSTARATRRANEIGVRKVMGAFRSALIGQILGEALIIVLISIVISLLMVESFLPLFNTLTGKTIPYNSVHSSPFLLMLVLLTLITGLLAGSYPAFYISSFQPAQVLKGKFTLSASSAVLRKSLVVFQFMIAVVLICGMFIISKQLTFIQEKNLGFDTKAKIIVPLGTLSARVAYPSLKNELLQNRSIKKISAADYLPGQYWNDIVLFPPGDAHEEGVAHFTNDVDYDFNDLLNIDMVAGRAFTDNLAAERNKIIINEVSARALGYTPAQAIGQKIEQHIFRDQQGAFIDYEIIGVMRDFHRMSLHEPITPALIKLYTIMPGETFDNMIVSADGKDLQGTIATIEKAWKKNVSDTPFEYSFLDENMQRLYTEDQRVSAIITTFTVIAFVICCLGLYGLSSYMAERRVKEIGIRKVMGASVNQIVRLMSQEFVKLVIIAIILAIPVAWYAMDQWLESFAYKTSIDSTVFLYGGAAALCIALLTVSIESFRAASQNPANALRSE